MPASFLNIPHIAQLKDISVKCKVKIWLVGGYLRDKVLKNGRDNKDFDFCVERDTRKVAASFARIVGSKVIVLDDAQESLRVIAKDADGNYSFDFTAMRSRSLKQDLFLRDFTVNSLAADICDPAKIIDVCGSIKDLKAKRLRSSNAKVFRDDPLRVLRGFAFMANYGFSFEGKTLKAMVAAKGLLRQVSGERLGMEFLKIFLSSDSVKTIKLMDKLRVLDEVLPCVAPMRGVAQEGGYHHLDVWEHSLEALLCMEKLCKKLSKHKECVEYCQQVVAQGRTRLQLIKLACLLHDIGKPKAKAKKNKKTIFYAHEKIGRDMAIPLMKNLRLSSKEISLIKGLIFWHLRPGYLADQKEPTRRAVYRFFRDTADDGVAVILLSLADWHATRGPLIDMKARKAHERVMLKLIDDYFLKKESKPVARLINGYDIMNKFGIGPSPLIGKILNSVQEAQALGKISNRDEALSLAGKMIKT